MSRSAYIHAVVLSLLGVLAILSLAYVCSAAALREGDRILSGVSVAGVDVGGLSAAQAEEKLRRFAQEQLAGRAHLRFGQRVFAVKLSALGFSVDVQPAVRQALRMGRRETILASLSERVRVLRSGEQIAIPLRVNKRRLYAALEAVALSLNRPPQDAQVVVRGSKLVVVPERVGLRLEVAETARRLLASRPLLGRQVSCPLIVTRIPPEVFARDLRDLEIIGQFTTHFPPWQTSRVNNIKLACKIMDGTIVPPGGIFSLNEAVGERSWERGFRYAPVYSGKKVIMGIGGGVCQVSTTTYNAARRAGMRIVERHQHSLPVHYVPWGMDATVSYPSPDMKFQNILDAPVVVKAKVEGSYLTVSLLARKGAKPLLSLAQGARKF